MKSLDLQLFPTPEKIAEAVDAVYEFLEPHGVSNRCIHHTAMLIEELLTNIGTHGGAIDLPATVKLTVDPELVSAEVCDHGVAFDPSRPPDPDISLPAEEREIGGLGLFLVRKFASTLDYSSENGMNKTSFALKRDEAPADH